MKNEREITRRLFEVQCSYERGVKRLEAGPVKDFEKRTGELKDLIYLYSEIARAYANAVRIVDEVVCESNAL